MNADHTQARHEADPACQSDVRDNGEGRLIKSQFSFTNKELRAPLKFPVGTPASSENSLC
jgi:hypothetical protein